MQIIIECASTWYPCCLPMKIAEDDDEKEVPRMCDVELYTMITVVRLSTIDECSEIFITRVILGSTLFEFPAKSTAIGIRVSSLAMPKIILKFAFVPSAIRPSFNAVKGTSKGEDSCQSSLSTERNDFKPLTRTRNLGANPQSSLLQTYDRRARRRPHDHDVDPCARSHDRIHHQYPYRRHALYQ